MVYWIACMNSNNVHDYILAHLSAPHCNRNPFKSVLIPFPSAMTLCRAQKVNYSTSILTLYTNNTIIAC